MGIAILIIALVALNSLVHIPAQVMGFVVPATTFLLSVALAAMGLDPAMLAGDPA